MALTPYKQLEQEWKRLHAFRGAMAVLRWDAAVMMPRGSADVRGEQLAALETEYHALVTAPRITRLLDRAQANTDGLEDWQIANLREMRRQRDFAIATPVALVSRLAKAASKAEVKWLQARESGKFEDFAPHLEEVIHLVRDKAQLLGQARNLSPYDALVDEFSPGLTSAEIDAMFKALGRRLPGLIRDVLAAQEKRPVLPITGKFSAGKQRALAVEIMKAVGFPFDRGRLDESEHAFTEGVPGVPCAGNTPGALRYAFHVLPPTPAAAARRWQCASAPAMPPRSALLPLPTLVMKKLIGPDGGVVWHAVSKAIAAADRARARAFLRIDSLLRV